MDKENLNQQLEKESEGMEIHTSHGAVIPPPPEMAERHYNDEVLTRQLREALRMDQRLTQAHVIGDVWDGIAYLSGEAVREEILAAAEEVARSVAGIRGVRNEMIVNPNLLLPQTPTEIF